MTGQAKEMADIALISMNQAFPHASITERVAASFLLASHFCTIIMAANEEEEVKERNKQVLEGMIMGLFQQLNPPAITH